MTHLLYHEHPYEKKFDATIVSVNGTGVVLDKTLFYPEGGGQPTDVGVIRYKDHVYNVLKVSRETKTSPVVHLVDRPGLEPGQVVEGEIDWEKRYNHMRMHTAQHLFCALVLDHYNASSTGNQIRWPTSRIDFEYKFTPEELQYLQKRFNEITSRDIQVRSYLIDRSQVEHEVTEPKRRRLFHVLPADLNPIRIAEIVGIDKNPCGGVQVKNTKEIGHMKIEKTENPGKGKMRIVYSLT